MKIIGFGSGANTRATKRSLTPEAEELNGREHKKLREILCTTGALNAVNPKDFEAFKKQNVTSLEMAERLHELILKTKRKVDGKAPKFSGWA